ncbi:hypothetical protein [Gloeocapsopsis dulcis]|nr:hypothetical protein [Gloeocapsopsis dulcis]WNN89305.1 hypothetical protein P0S91_24225 [Gloeocapsopsis dulcis]
MSSVINTKKKCAAVTDILEALSPPTTQRANDRHQRRPTPSHPH